MAGVETPLPEYLRREEADRADRENKRRKIDTSRGLDVGFLYLSRYRYLGLLILFVHQDFQHVYTSEDNASFLEILTEDNARRKEKYSWAFEAETKAKENRLQLEQGRRRLLIEHGGYIPTDDGLLRLTLGDEAEKTIRENKNKELVAGPNGKLLLIQAKQDEKENERKSIKGKEPETSTALTKVDKGKRRATADEEDEDEVLAMILGDSSGDGQPSSSNTALIRAAPQMNAPDISEQQLVIPNALPRAIDLPPDPFPQETLLELPLPGDSHLARALNHAGLPETALINKDGQLVPARDVASGSGNGLGRGFDEKARRELIEKEVMGDEKDERSRAVPTWAYRVRFPAIWW
jgi:protein DGCR14